MHSALNLLVFPSSVLTVVVFFNERAMCSPEKLHLEITIIIIIIRGNALAVTASTRRYAQELVERH